MAHIYPDYPTKKAFKEALKAGKKIEVINMSLLTMPESGITTIEAPARMHRWYALVEYDNMIITKVKR